MKSKKRSLLAREYNWYDFGIRKCIKNCKGKDQRWADDAIFDRINEEHDRTNQKEWVEWVKNHWNKGNNEKRSYNAVD